MQIIRIAPLIRTDPTYHTLLLLGDLATVIETKENAV